MARNPRDARIETREARKRLKVRKEPYWRQIHKGLSIGYYRGVNGGSWSVRRKVDGRNLRQRIGKADDFADADGEIVLSYQQAVEAAMSTDRPRPATDVAKYTVREAVDEYLKDLAVRSPEGVHDAQLRFDKHVLPKLGSRPVASLTRAELRRWHHAIAATRSDDPEEVRRRKATANRNLSTLKAALNLAYREDRVSDRAAWDQVRAFRGVNVPRVRYLTAAEARRLVNASEPGFRPLVQAALLTGCRYGDLTRLRVSHFDADAGVITVHERKTGKVRHVPLTDEGQTFFEDMTAGRAPNERILTKADGTPWKKSEQSRPMRAACEGAGIDPPISLHILRHTYGSLLARKGVPLQVISAAMGHADTRMTQRHYAHLQPDHVAEQVRKALPKFSSKSSRKIVRMK